MQWGFCELLLQWNHHADGTLLTLGIKFLMDSLQWLCCISNFLYPGRLLHDILVSCHFVLLNHEQNLRISNRDPSNIRHKMVSNFKICCIRLSLILVCRPQGICVKSGFDLYCLVIKCRYYFIKLAFLRLTANWYKR